MRSRFPDDGFAATSSERKHSGSPMTAARSDRSSEGLFSLRKIVERTRMSNLNIVSASA